MKRLVLYTTFVLFAALWGCKKPEEGFLSSNVFYRANPFEAKTGVVAASAPLETDGSTAPLTVKLLAIRNKTTGADAKDLLVEREVNTFLAGITATDTSLALLEAKIKKSKVKPFNVNSTGGRLEFSSATAFVTPGIYTIDLEVANVRGTRIINDACEIRLSAPALTDLYKITYTAWTTNPIGTETDYVAPSSSLNIGVTHDPTGPNKIIFKWRDKNGALFNPKQGDVVRRGDRPEFSELSPYYPEEKTDTALVYQYPSIPVFPVKPSKAYNNFLIYYRIPGAKVDIQRNVNTVSEIRFYYPGTTGTWNVTYNISVAAKL